MITITRKTECDVCKKEVERKEFVRNDIRRMESKNHVVEMMFPTPNSISVVFTTNQTDGYPSKPYLSTERIDLCTECKGKVFEGKQLFAYGAQGYNTYYFKGEK